MKIPTSFRSPVRNLSLVAVAAVSLSLNSCETPGSQSAITGAGVGAAAGAVIGNQSGNAAEGALIGGAAGAATGYGVGRARQNNARRVYRGY